MNEIYEWTSGIHMMTMMTMMAKMTKMIMIQCFRITEIYEGTSEIQAVVIAGHMQKEYRNAQIAMRKAVN